MTQINRLFSQSGVTRPAVGGSGGDAGLLGRGAAALAGGLANEQVRQDRMQAQRDEFWVKREQQKFDRDMLQDMTAIQDASREDGGGYREAATQAYEARLSSALANAPNAAARDMLARNAELSRPDFDEALFTAERGMMRDYTVGQIEQVVDDGAQLVRREALNTPEPGRTAVAARIAAVESGGRSDARNPNSSATGKFQFVRSTWLEQVKANRPDIAQGKTDDEIWALATDDDLQDEMEGHFRNENVRHLAANGIDADPGAVYLAHFAGRGGAVKALKAEPDTPISKVMGRSAIEANAGIKFNGKNFAEFTAGDLVDWSRSKMGVEVSSRKDAQGVPVWNGPVPTPERSAPYVEALSNVNELLEAMPGSRAQKSKLKKAAKRQLTRTWMASLAEVSPPQAMAALRSGKYDSALTLADDQSVEGIASSAYQKFEREIAAQQKKIETARKEKQALTASILRVEVQNGDASETEVDAAFAQGEISHQSWATQRIAAMGVREQNAAETRKLTERREKAASALFEVGILSGEVGANDLMERVKSGDIPLTEAPGLFSKILKRDKDQASDEQQALDRASRDEEKAASAQAKNDEKQAKRLRGVIGGRALIDAHNGVYDVSAGEQLVLDGNMTEADHQQAIGIQEKAARSSTGKEDKSIAAREAVAIAYDTGIPPDMTDKNIREAVDEQYRASIEASENPVAMAAVFVERINTIPEAMKSDIGRAMMGSDEEAQLMAMNMAGAVLAISPDLYGEFTRSDRFGDGLKVAVAANSMHEGGRDPAEAVKRAREGLEQVSPAAKARRDVFRQEKMRDEAHSELESILAGEDGVTTFRTPAIDASVSARFVDAVEAEYARFGDLPSAIAVAKTEFLRRHAVTSIGSERRWQRDAPEKIYGIWGDDRDAEWIEGQARQFLEGVETDRIMLHTASSPREQPYYIVLYENEDGIMVPGQGRFRPDPDIARVAAATAAELTYQSDVAAKRSEVAIREQFRTETNPLFPTDEAARKTLEASQ